jgi:hypothetical protein
LLEKLNPEEVHILGNIVNRTFEREKDELNLTHFTGDMIDGYSAKLAHSNIGLFKRDVKASLKSASTNAAAIINSVTQVA